MHLLQHFCGVLHQGSDTKEGGLAHWNHPTNKEEHLAGMECLLCPPDQDKVLCSNQLFNTGNIYL
jgi:hypothetical protein